MNNLQKRIETLNEVFDRWLSDDNEHLLRAVHQTVEENYFSFSDVQFALKSLKNKLGRNELEKWIEKNGITNKSDAKGENVLCLHAGNLPLVGFQDALAVLLSGARYTGKISRKDPYLLPSFLNEVKKTETWSGVDVQWSHRLDDFEGMQNDAILFAGSEESVPGVKQAINRFNLKKQDTWFLVRTAHFSMAYFDRKENKDIQNLAEAILRYGGKGCRSVAVVVSPFSFESIGEELRKACKAFLDENPQHEQPAAKLHQRFAYNKAVEREQLWLDDFLIQEGGRELDQDFICYWVQGDKQKVKELETKFGDQLQSIYTVDSSNVPDGIEKETELLSNAQQPPAYWKPDGIDTLKWLCCTL